MNIGYYIRIFPITSAIIIFCGLIFIANHLGALPYTVSVPGMITSGTFLSHFSHFSLMHIVMNMAICSQISPILEKQMSTLQYLLVILFIWFLTISITFPFMQNPTLGFSGIMMGLIVFTIGIFYWNKILVKNLFIWLIINIIIGLMPQISFIGHFGGAVAGGIVFLCYKLLKR